MDSTHRLTERRPRTDWAYFVRAIAEAYSRGQLIVEALPEYRDLFFKLAEKLLANQSGKGG